MATFVFCTVHGCGGRGGPNALQIKTTNANRHKQTNTSKLRKHFYQLDNTYATLRKRTTNYDNNCKQTKHVQITTTNASRQNTSKLRKHRHHLGNICTASIC